MPPVMDPSFSASGIRHVVHQLREPEEFSIAVSGGNLVADFFARHQAPTRIEQFQTPLWTLDFQEANVKAHIHCPLPKDWASVGFMRSPVESSWYGQPAASGVLMCNPPGQAIDGCIVPGFRCLTMSVPAAVWERCATLAGCEGASFGIVSAVLLPPNVHVRLEKKLGGMAAFLKREVDLPGGMHVSHVVDEFVTEVLTTAWELSSGIPLRKDSSRNRTRLAHRAEEWMRAHLGEAVQVPQVCLALGVSRRELEYAFRTTFDQSPRDFLQTIRLNAVRRLLMNSSQHFNLIDVAFDHGIGHLGRFAKNYRDLFGENPSLSRKRSVRL